MLSIQLTGPHRIRFAALVLGMFPIAVLLLSRQIAANAVGLGKDALSAAFVFVMSLAAIAGFDYRLKEVRQDFWAVDALTLVQSALAGIAICLYFLAGKIEPSEAIASGYYYCIAPFLVYLGFLLCRVPDHAKKAALIALSLAYLLTLVVSVCEVFGIEFWLFANDRWYLQPSPLGFSRATGLYGSQIDYGCLSFIVFSAAYYARRTGADWRKSTMMILSCVGLLLSLSRVWIAAAVAVVVVDLATSGSWKRIRKAAFVGILLLAALYPAAELSGVLDMLTVNDEVIYTSNEDRLYYYRSAPKWLLEDYPVVGTGPGIQNGPDVHGKKFVADALWLAMLIDFGTSAGSVLLLLKIGFIAYLLVRAYKKRPDSPLRSLTMALCLAQLLASIVDSAFAQPVSISLVYVVAGLFLYADSRSATNLSRQAVKPEVYGWR